MKKSLQILMLLAMPFLVHAQQISGTVSDKNGPVIGATVSISSSNGTITDVNGTYSLKVPAGTHDVSVAFVGYNKKTQSVTVASGENKTLNVTIEENVELLNELVVVGTRSRPRSNVDTAVPVDILDAKDLTSTGQNTFDKALTYRVPSFNSVQTPVNDATSLLDPYEIRNMGPSRTLILINGKRKNLSALLYTQTSPGRGETGADISAIPQDAIERVEILRDGASAQYGSDAIAGVMNIILKDDVDYGSVTLRAGITGEGDGESVGVSLNAGTGLGNGGFLNYTVDFSKRELANRPGTVNAQGEASDFGAALADVQEFLNRRPDAGNINGSPETTAAKFLVNGGFNISDNTKGYFNGAYVYKNVNSYANYRTPYWRTVADMPYLADFFPGNHPTNPGGYDGYVPTFDGLLNDYNGTLGVRSEMNGWTYDGSFTVGGNTQTYKVTNSHNRNFVYSPSTWLDANGNGSVDDGEINEGSLLYRENSPISFDPGGTKFNHIVGNIDISKEISSSLAMAFGAEFRNETFTVIEGGKASYDGGGADSFAGNTPENSGKFNRYNFGGYFDLSFDVTEDFLLNGTVRAENYSDFGQAFVWKLSSRYKLMDDKMTVRASASTGFRAPTLHQIYTQKAQYSFVPGAGIQVGGLVNNVSPQAKLLGIPQLDAEESFNFTVGMGLRPSDNFDITVDYYNISVSDRIVLSTEIGPTAGGGTPLDQVLADNNLSDVSFFVNALDTKTSGIDFVANYKNLGVGNGTLGFTLSGNYTIENERDGDVKNPDLVAGAGQSVVNETQEALFFTSRPKTKWILGINYDLGKFGFSLNNTYFGTTTFRQQGMDSNLKTEFKPKVVTDLGVNFRASDKVNISFNVNNILNVLPEWEFKALNASGETLLNDPAQVQNQSNLITFNQRYSQMTYDGYHFSQLGSLYNLTVNVRF
ncbi:MAG: TonB-dependent receptor [Reichenbachiella sp.]|uniref:TonB-dependent receptor n=1 Tax=Reichenbachiella sp. TaxID=2184521 RepID=UPI002967018B|nr:TonB-dependent receptor [Reichenbachiella sp.]MDW3208508.1 TonB-dependent receptor [Reichenbachiella sp.]